MCEGLRVLHEVLQDTDIPNWLLHARMLYCECITSSIVAEIHEYLAQLVVHYRPHYRNDFTSVVACTNKLEFCYSDNKRNIA